MANRRNPNAGYGDEQDSLFAPRTTPGAPGATLPTNEPPQTTPGQKGPELAPTAPQAPIPNVPILPDFTKRGQYLDNSGAYDFGKLDMPWDQKSEKYQIGTVLSNFDPTKGITPELIDALNKANIHGAKFSGAEDILNVDNAGGWDRFGKGGASDIGIGLKSGNGTWGAWTDPALTGPIGGGNDPRINDILKMLIGEQQAEMPEETALRQPDYTDREQWYKARNRDAQ